MSQSHAGYSVKVQWDGTIKFCLSLCPHVPFKFKVGSECLGKQYKPKNEWETYVLKAHLLKV